MYHSNPRVLLQNLFKILKNDLKRFLILFCGHVVGIQVMLMMMVVCVFPFM